MAKEICISTTPHETRLAILEDDQLAEVYYERENEYTLAGSIYKGRVTRVLPGMQSSFVDVGLERDAFLYVTDFLEEQEDSEEYASDAGRRPRPEAQEEPLPRAAAAERNGGERSERQPDRNQDRNQDRGGRRPQAASLQAEAAPSREGGRAGRERAREQAIAPLREAVPATQDLEEKGDEESPEGTRRWRGRRGRRRGVRGGLPKAEPRVLLSDSPTALEEASTAEESAAAPFAIAEHGAPGGIAALHASPTRDQADPGAESGREQGVSRSQHAGRDRSPRRSREPYAQASTLDRVAGESVRAHGDGSSEEPAQPRSSGAIVLPGESLSKYGSVAADPALQQPATANVPKTVRPVNYVAPKPSTLVELSGDWDGGAVLPGETLSRYRGAEAAAPPAPAALLPVEETAETSADEIGAGTEVEGAAEQTRFGVGPDSPDHADHGDAAIASAHQEEPSSFHQEPGEVGSHDASPWPEGYEQPSGSEAGASGSVAELAEPEIMAAAVTPAAEAGTAQIAEPVWSGDRQPEGEPDQHTRLQPEAASAEPAEYEPESASASYRVQLGGASELRLAGHEIEAGAWAEEGAQQAQTEPEEPTFAEPSGQFAGSAPIHEVVEKFASHPFAEAAALHSSVPEFSGSLAAQADAAGDQGPHEGNLAPRIAEESVSEASHGQGGPPLQILHADGSVVLVEGSAHGAATPAYPEPEHSPAEPFEVKEFAFSQSRLETGAETAHDLDHDVAEGGHPESSEELLRGNGAAPAADFREMVDRLQGFAPGLGLLEEETIDEDEYDFEPMHAHAEEGDQEDLEEETLDQQVETGALSDAVRDVYLEERLQRPHAESAATAIEEEDGSFGFEEVEEGEEEFDEGEEGEEPVPGQPVDEPQRLGRTEDGRGRGRGQSGGRGVSRSGGRRNGGPGRGRSAQSQDLPIISELLKQGQEILVQIAKEPIAKKGARITSHIALPGRFLVFMPTVHHVGVSRKIASDEERQRLKRILISEKGENTGGFIVRTAAEGAGEEDLRADLRFLISLWTEIKQRSDTAKAPALIYHDLNLIERILRDQVSSNFSTIWVDSEAEYERIIRFLSRFQPQLVRRVKLYTKETPLFEHFGIQEEISKALKSKVWLKSGGSIVINQTEALVAIDINTGKYVGKTSRLEDTIVKTNLDAIPEIVRQIRLRDLGGIIVIDFIDMDERKNRNRVLAALEEELKNDRAPSKVLQFNDFGLVAITRKRVKQSLERTLSVTCETCTGTGMVKSPVTVCNEIYTEMRKMLKHLDGKDVMLRVHPEVVKQLKLNNGKWINELEELVVKTIIIKSDPALHPEQFDIH